MKGSVIMFIVKNKEFSSCQSLFTSLIIIIALAAALFKVLSEWGSFGNHLNVSELAATTITLSAVMLILNCFLFRHYLIPSSQLSAQGLALSDLHYDYFRFISDKSKPLNIWQKQFRYKKLPTSKQHEFQTCLLDNIDKSIVVLNRFNEIIYCNQSARLLFDISVNEAGFYNKGKFPFGQNKLDRIKDYISSGQAWNEEQSIMVDGMEKTTIHQLHSLNRNEGSDEMIVVSYDITDFVRARQTAEKANTAKSHFLANITHELRTPMIGILGSVDLLEHAHLNQQQLASVDTIRECGERLLGIIDDMLEVSKIEGGLLELSPSINNLRDILRKTTSIIEPNLRNKGLLLELDIDDNLPGSVVLDQIKLRQIITNLLSNAVKFTSRGGIKIKASMETTSSSDNWLLITIADTGIGISPNMLESIFNYFTQADASNSRNFGGIGLGLYICKRLVDLMAGDIWVKSQEGVGSTFGFRIPLEVSFDKQYKTIFADSPDLPAEDEFSSGFVPISVLLVEDNELNQKLVAQMLLNYGFEVITAANGLECLNILQYKNIDIVLMDMQMPIMDGYEATRLIRENKNWAQLPIIAITANSMSIDRDKCLACGCSSYLAKPFKSEALVREIKTYLKNQFIKEKNADPLSQQLIADLLPEFMEMLGEILIDLEEAIDLKDLDSIKSISHSLKGTAGMYGFMQISELAAYIEKATNDKNYQRMFLLYQQIVSLAQQFTNQSKSKVVI